MDRSVQEARAAFRQRHLGGRYSGPLHLATTIVISLAAAAVCILRLEDVRAAELWTVPLTFLYANLSEYLGHRGPMHRRMRFLGLIFRRHSLEHHRFFTDAAMTFESNSDFKAVLFPPYLIVFFVAGFALPVGIALHFVATPNVASLFVLTAVLYFLNYELLHFAYHADPGSSIGRLPFMDRLRRHHTLHHDPRFMTRYNFNITYPICDHLFATARKQSS